MEIQHYVLNSSGEFWTWYLIGWDYIKPIKTRSIPILHFFISKYKRHGSMVHLIFSWEWELKFWEKVWLFKASAQTCWSYLCPPTKHTHTIWEPSLLWNIKLWWITLCFECNVFGASWWGNLAKNSQKYKYWECFLMICSFYSFHDSSGRQFFWSFANYPNTRLILGVVSKSLSLQKSFTNKFTLILKETEFWEGVPSFPLIPFFTLDSARSSS